MKDGRVIERKQTAWGIINKGTRCYGVYPKDHGTSQKSRGKKNIKTVKNHGQLGKDEKKNMEGACKGYVGGGIREKKSSNCTRESNRCKAIGGSLFTNVC